MTLKIIPILLTILITGCTSNKKASENTFHAYLQDIESLKVQKVDVFNSNETFSNAFNLIADSAGNMVFAEYPTLNLYYLTSAGNLIDKKAGRGRGPGELTLINNFTIGCDNKLKVLGSAT